MEANNCTYPSVQEKREWNRAGMIIFALSAGINFQCDPDLPSCGTAGSAASRLRKQGRPTCCASAANWRLPVSLSATYSKGYAAGLARLPPANTVFYLGIIAIAACLAIFIRYFSALKAGKGVATAFGSIAAIGWDLTGLVAGTRR